MNTPKEVLQQQFNEVYIHLMTQMKKSVSEDGKYSDRPLRDWWNGPAQGGVHPVGRACAILCCFAGSRASCAACCCACARRRRRGGTVLMFRNGSSLEVPLHGGEQ